MPSNQIWQQFINLCRDLSAMWEFGNCGILSIRAISSFPPPTLRSLKITIDILTPISHTIIPEKNFREIFQNDKSTYKILISTFRRLITVFNKTWWPGKTIDLFFLYTNDHDGKVMIVSLPWASWNNYTPRNHFILLGYVAMSNAISSMVLFFSCQVSQ